MAERAELDGLIIDIERAGLPWLLRRAGLAEENDNPDKQPYFANVNGYKVYSTTAFLALFEAFARATGRIR